MFIKHTGYSMNNANFFIAIPPPISNRVYIMYDLIRNLLPKIHSQKDLDFHP